MIIDSKIIRAFARITPDQQLFSNDMPVVKLLTAAGFQGLHCPENLGEIVGVLERNGVEEALVYLSCSRDAMVAHASLGMLVGKAPDAQSIRPLVLDAARQLSYALGPAADQLEQTAQVIASGEIKPDVAMCSMCWPASLRTPIKPPTGYSTTAVGYRSRARALDNPIRASISAAATGDGHGFDVNALITFF